MYSVRCLPSLDAILFGAICEKEAVRNMDESPDSPRLHLCMLLIICLYVFLFARLVYSPFSPALHCTK
jgi:hypothetical protein